MGVPELLSPNNIKNWVTHRSTEAYVIGYPKTGNTWIRLMLGKYLQLILGEDDIGSIPLFAEIDSFGRCKRWHPNFPTILFTHGNLTWTNQTFENLTIENTIQPYRAMKVAFLVRSIPDTLISHFWHMKTMNDPPYPYGPADYIRDPILGCPKMVRFLNLWSENRKLPKDFQFFRYESFKSDPYKEFNRLLHFLDAPIIDKFVSESIEFSKFENMRKIETNNKTSKTLTYKNTNFSIFATGDVKKNSEAFHVRKGIVGGYKEYLNDEDIEYLKSYCHQHLSTFYEYTDGFP